MIVLKYRGILSPKTVYALVEVGSKNDKVQTAKKVTKINLRITTKPRAYLQTLTKTPVKFQKDLDKIVGVAFTRWDIICDGEPDGQTGTQGNTICLPTLTGRRGV